MRQVNSFFILAGAAALVACATQAPAPAPASHELALVPATAHPGLNTYGYQRKVIEGRGEMFCRNDLVTGSRTEHEGEKCYTADELQRIQQNSQQFIDAVQGHGSMATATGTPGAGH
ncbi:MAG TPA: hypothetical protein VIY90_03935 [Steroidobacteraceae bacterium]